VHDEVCVRIEYRSVQHFHGSVLHFSRTGFPVPYAHYYDVLLFFLKGRFGYLLERGSVSATVDIKTGTRLDWNETSQNSHYCLKACRDVDIRVKELVVRIYRRVLRRYLLDIMEASGLGAK
jgi:hypothetical protein